MTRDVEDRITAIAARQHGVITRAQLMEAGLSAGAVARRLQAGRIRGVHRGVYTIGPLSPPTAPIMAAVLVGGPGATVSHVTARSLWGWGDAGSRGPARPRPARREHPEHPEHPEPFEHRGHLGRPDHPRRTDHPGRPDRAFPASPAAPLIDITVEGAKRGHRPGIRVHRVARLDSHERTTLDGIPVITPGRTLVDLAAEVGARELETAVARAEREGHVDRAALEALVARHRGRPGIPALRAVLEAPTGPALTRSEAELRFLALVRSGGLPPPEANVRVGPYELDFLWRTAGLAVEVDGFRYHSSRPRFRGDRRKDARLLAAGITVLRLSWDQITDEGLATAVQVGRALTRAELRAGG